MTDNTGNNKKLKEKQDKTTNTENTEALEIRVPEERTLNFAHRRRGNFAQRVRNHQRREGEALINQQEEMETNLLHMNAQNKD